MIVVVPKQTISPAQKAALNKKGYVVIECNEPEKVRIITAESPVNTNDYFMSALKAIAEDSMSRPKEIFIKELFRRLVEQESSAINAEKGGEG